MGHLAGLRRVPDIHGFDDILAVAADGVDTYAQYIRYLFTGMTLRYQLQNFLLTLGEHI